MRKNRMAFVDTATQARKKEQKQELPPTQAHVNTPGQALSPQAHSWAGGQASSDRRLGSTR